MSSESPRQEASDGCSGSDKSDSVECPTCGELYNTKRGMKIHHSKIHNESLAFTYNCDWCGVEYETRPAVIEENENNFCCDDCYAEWLSKYNSGEDSHCWVGYETTTCKKCGDDFEHKPYLDRTFCSRNCRDNYSHGSESNFWKGGKVTLECVECGDSFKVHPSRVGERKRCSNECTKNSVFLECEYCNTTFKVPKSQESKRKCCSRDCWAKLRSTYPSEMQPNYRGGVSEYDYGYNWYEQRKKARKRDQYRCQVCGKDERQLGKIPSCHHIVKLRKFKDKYEEPKCYDRGNSLDNLIILCEKHHKKWEGIPLRPETT